MPPALLLSVLESSSKRLNGLTVVGTGAGVGVETTDDVVVTCIPLKSGIKLSVETVVTTWVGVGVEREGVGIGVGVVTGIVDVTGGDFAPQRTRS
jgi:hypothetical protein